MQARIVKERVETARRFGAIVGQGYEIDAGRRTTVTVERTRKSDHAYRLDIRLERDDGDCRTVFFDVESPMPVEPPTLDDPALLVAVFPALAHGGALHVDGEVSARLVRNVHELQAIWVRARPDRYRPFRVTANRVVAAVRRAAGRGALMPLSGGLDSMTTLYRHTDPERPLGAATVDIECCLFLPGFSPRARRSDEYRAAADRVRRIAARKGLPVIVAETNFGDQVRWLPDPNGTLLGAALNCFADRFSVGLIGGTTEHLNWDYPYHASTAAFDPLLSSGGMEIRDDGVELIRDEKAAALSHYPEALEDLVVCFEQPGFAGNCCRCEKCIRTMINFLAVGEPIPPSFPHPIDPKRVGKRLVTHVRQSQVRTTLRIARSMGVRHPILRRLRRKYLRRRLGYGARYALTWLLPGTDLLYRDHVLPRWLVRRKARAALGAPRENLR